MSTDQHGHSITLGSITANGDLSAHSVYNKMQVYYMASSKQDTITCTTSLIFFHINIVGSTTAANSYTDGAVHATPINVGSISTKAEVNPRIAAKQNSSTCSNPITLDYLFARFPFLVWSNTIPCLSVAPPLSLTMNGHNCSQ